MKRSVDATDRMIVGWLSKDGRMSVSELAGRTGISRPTIASRLRSLLDDGLLRVSGVLDVNKTQDLTTALVGLSLDNYRLDEMVERISGLDEVSWAAVVTGRYDIIAQIVTDDGMQGLYRFLNESLMAVGGIGSSEVFVVMKSSGKWSALPRGMAEAWAGGPET